MRALLGKRVSTQLLMDTQAGKKQRPRGPPAKPTAPPKCGEPTRDKTRALFSEALHMAAADVENPDAGAVAAEVETAMYFQNGGVNAKYKAKYRSLSFNLKAAENPDLRRRVLCREISAQDLMELPPEELASDSRKEENAKIREHAMWEAERGQNLKKATTDAFQCGKCKQWKCIYFQMQTRSADEPMTTFVTCVNCQNRWKFC
ncbi:hypothetical protein WJX72_000295 [[Myrmecia] bisecta]|uniref:Transcription elongation factor S-II n=1 Tax=[Myrmecia] bisecta TaxID=41462 RepID=A0AAW1PBU8_9CHLO